MAHASGAAVSGGLDCNVSNWLGRYHQINKMREKYSRDEPSGVGGASGGSSTRMHKNPPSSSGLDSVGSSAGILSDFTTYT